MYHVTGCCGCGGAAYASGRGLRERGLRPLFFSSLWIRKSSTTNSKSVEGGISGGAPAAPYACHAGMKTSHTWPTCISATATWRAGKTSNTDEEDPPVPIMVKEKGKSRSYVS